MPTFKYTIKHKNRHKMGKLQYDERQFKLTLPKKLLEALGWKKGDEINIQLGSQGEIILNNATTNEKREQTEKIDYAR